MNIYTAMKSLVAVQESIAITLPRPTAVKKAYLSVPSQSQSVVTMLPCWTNSWDFVREERHGALRTMAYLVNMRLHVARVTQGDNAIAAEIALAFLDPILTAFGSVNASGIGGVTLIGDVAGTLTSTVTHQNIRGGSPTLAVFGEGDARTIGLDLICEMEMSDAFSYS